jgi:hypothetical protein
MEQKMQPFLVSPDTWHDPQRFNDLALADCECLSCDAPIGWESVPMGDSDGQIWHDYYTMNEDMEELYCPQCYLGLDNQIRIC